MSENKAINIGISGAEGSFSEEAARHYSDKNGLKNTQIHFLINAEPVLTALDKGEIDVGVFPIENSNGGIVYEAVHAMAAHTFSVQEFFDIDVRHNLLVVKGVTRDQIETITSHDQALKQCRMYIKKMWPHISVEEYRDTAQAAKDLGAGALPKTTAVIATRRAAELYDLDILEESIQDLKFNFTTFLAVIKQKKSP